MQGENVTISLTITNAGLATARNVVVKSPLKRFDWEKVCENELQKEFQTIDVGETKKIEYTYKVQNSGEYVVDKAQIQYFASETREVTKGESNVVKGVQVLTAMQDKARKALRVSAYVTYGALKTVEDYVYMSKWIGSISALIIVNQVLLKIKRALQSLRRIAAVRGLEGEDNAKLD
jgi:hypothetical protein